MNNHGIEARSIHVDLVEALPRLLPKLPKKTSKAVGKRLRKLGIKLYLGRTVQGETADELTVSGKPVRSHTVVWTAGVTNHPFFKENGFAIMGGGKVGVNAYLQTEPGIYVIGDNANTPYSGLAQTALHDGDFVAHNLKRQARGKDMKSYIAHKPITVIPAGPYWSAVIWGRAQFSGRIGWLLREAADLIGFHDVEPWPEATHQFLSEFSYQDDCDVCAAATAS
jgi:NADH dehydrogenase